MDHVHQDHILQERCCPVAYTLHFTKKRRTDRNIVQAKIERLNRTGWWLRWRRDRGRIGNRGQHTCHSLPFFLSFFLANYGWANACLPEGVRRLCIRRNGRYGSVSFCTAPHCLFVVVCLLLFSCFVLFEFLLFRLSFSPFLFLFLSVDIVLWL